MNLTAIETALIDQVAAALQGRVRRVDGLPGNWTPDLLRQAVQDAPGAWVAFLGGPANRIAEGLVDGRWAVYVVTRYLSGRAVGRQGNAAEIGAYEALGAIVSRLDRLALPGIGSVRLIEVKNLFAEAVANLGGTVFAAVFTVPCAIDPPTAEAALAPFVTYHQDLSLAAGAPPATDEVTLPQ